MVISHVNLSRKEAVTHALPFIPRKKACNPQQVIQKLTTDSYQTIGNHKHYSIWKSYIICSNRIKLNVLCLTKNKSKKISVSEARKETLELTMCKQCLFVVNYLLYFLSLSIHTLSTKWFAGGTHKKYDKETCKLKYICKDIWSSGLVLTVISSKWILTVPDSAKKEIDWSILRNTRTYELSIA